MNHPVVTLTGVTMLFSGSVAAETTMKTNDDPNLPINTDLGDRVLTYDFSEFEVGIAEYPDGPTGVTVLHFPAGARVALDVRGGAPGVIGDYGYVNAISLAGGSLLGLEAASGVAAGLLAQGGYKASWQDIPLVSGGIVFDFGTRSNSIYPDKRLGRVALENAVPNRFPLGARGAGIAVTVGKGLAFDRGEPAGQGQRSARLAVSSYSPALFLKRLVRCLIAKAILCEVIYTRHLANGRRLCLTSSVELKPQRAQLAHRQVIRRSV